MLFLIADFLIITPVLKSSEIYFGHDITNLGKRLQNIHTAKSVPKKKKKCSEEDYN